MACIHSRHHSCVPSYPRMHFTHASRLALECSSPTCPVLPSNALHPCTCAHTVLSVRVLAVAAVECICGRDWTHQWAAGVDVQVHVEPGSLHVLAHASRQQTLCNTGWMVQWMRILVAGL
eukprot:271202-Chlamydomonas_euryale.AAC.4